MVCKYFVKTFLDAYITKDIGKNSPNEKSLGCAGVFDTLTFRGSFNIRRIWTSQRLMNNGMVVWEASKGLGQTMFKIAGFYL